MSKDAQPWTEKYRPHQLRGVAFQGDVVRVLQTTLQSHTKQQPSENGPGGPSSFSATSASFAKTSDVPNLLFYGPPGTGKTSTVGAIARSWFPTPELYRERVLEMNASDERGIDSVRKIVIAFARQPVLPDPANKIPPFRLLILDEADSMTEKAQASLRRVMERYATYTRFCLLCNYLSGLLAPLVSRCAVFYFRTPTPSQMFVRLDLIAKREQLLIGKDDEEHKQILMSFAEHSEGDMRKALHWMQCLKGMWIATQTDAAFSSSASFFSAALSAKITAEKGAAEKEKRVEERVGSVGEGFEPVVARRCDAELAKTVLNNMSARPPEYVVAGLTAALLSKRLPFSLWYRKLHSRVYDQGYSIVACLQMICDALLREAESNLACVGAVCEYLERLSEIDAALHKGADGQLQMLSLFHPLVAAKTTVETTKTAENANEIN